MFNFVENLMINNGASFIADFFGVIFNIFGRTIGNLILNIFSTLWNLFTKWVWYICKWVLGILDALQLAFSRLVGIDLGTGNSMTLDDYIDGMKSITISGGSNYYDYLMKIFRTLAAVAIVLMIIFTIYAMIMQDYKLSISGYQKADNSKAKFIKRIFANIITICLIPLIFYTIIIGTNSILTSFYRALGGYSNTTIAGNVLAASTYDANRYRTYANSNKRIPITIEVYSTENVFGKALSDDEIKKSINDEETQNKLKAIAGAFANDSFLPFSQSTVYENGIWTSYSNYSLSYNNSTYDNLGQYFENFICTREQYYVLADFIDYCQLYNVQYYIKEISESDICWKYVDNIEAELDEEGNSLGDITLTVSYRDAEIVNNPTGVASAATTSSSENYSLKFSTKLDLTSPISDALKTAATLLGINESTSKFNAMERDDSGDFVNLVSWSTRKVFLKLSDGFKLDDARTWTFSDQIIVYEYYRFQNENASTNNTLQSYTLDKIKEGILLDAMELKYRNYNSYTGSYGNENKLYCVKINGNYYRVKESDNYFDDYGTAYFELTVADENTPYFENVDGEISTTIIINNGGKQKLGLSDGFDINKTETWTFTDQVLVYEYFKDLSLSNGLRRTNQFSDFKGDGVEFNKVVINGKDYIYINGTYYEYTTDFTSTAVPGSFLVDTTAAEERWFGYQLGAVSKEKYGIDFLDDGWDRLIELSDTANASEEIAAVTDAYYQKYSSINMKLSEDFSFYNTDTWTFRDYVIMGVFVNYLSPYSTKYTVSYLKSFGLTGDFVVIDNAYYLKIHTSEKFIYIKLEVLSNVSEEKITSSISASQYEKIGLDLSNIGFETSYTKGLTSDMLLSSNIETHTFNISENFDAYNPETWTVGDYLLLYLRESGLIKTDIDNLKENGYNSLVYVYGDNKYYRLGALNEDGTIPDGTIFLDESKIKENTIKNYDVDKFFKANLMSFILQEKYNTTINNLVFSSTTFADGTISNASSFIYSLDENYSNLKNLQYVLAKDFLKRSDITTGKELIDYKYSNPYLSISDPTTWSKLDALIYLKTGSLPTRDNPFETTLYYDGSDIYMLIDNETMAKVGDYCDGTTKQILSNKLWQFSDETTMNSRYTKYFEPAISEEIPEGFTASVDEFYYYSSTYPGAFDKNVAYSDFDIVLCENNIAKQESGKYTFEYYTSATSSSVYVKLKEGVYFEITNNQNAYIRYENNSIVSKSEAAKAFIKDGEYEAFEETTRMDAIIYSLTGNTSKRNFVKYKLDGGDHYLFIEGKMVKYVEGSVITSLGGDADKKAAYITKLYEKYYKSYVSYTQPATKTVYSNDENELNVYAALKIGSGWDWNNLSNWTVLKIILAANNIEDSESKKLLLSTSGDYYLKTKDIYINLSSIANVSCVSGISGYSITLTDRADATSKLQWQLRLVDYNAGICEIIEPTILDNISGFTNKDNIINDLGTEEYGESGSLDSWTWRGLLSAYIKQNGTCEIRSVYNLDEDKVYYIFSGPSLTYIVPYEIINGSVLDMFEDPETINPSTTSKLYKVLTASELETDNVAKYVSKFEVNGDKLVFYKSKLVDSERFLVVYNLVGADEESSAVKYVKIELNTGVIPNVYEFSLTTEASEAATLDVFAAARTALVDWTTFDFAVAYVTALSGRNHILSYIYYYNNNYYIYFNDYYILIPLSEDYRSESKLGDWLEATTENIIGLRADKSVSVYDAAKNEDFALEFDDFDADVQENLSKYVSDKNDIENVKAEKLQFSANFDYSDYSTWTISDYILYYAVVNGMYGTEEFECEFPFTYVPTYKVRNGTYIELTYLDIVLAKLFGVVDEDAEDVEFNYFRSAAASYEFMLVYNNSNEFFLKIVTDDDKEHYIELNNKISIDFSTMNIVSSEISENYTDKSLKNWFDLYRSETYWVDSITDEKIFTTKYSSKNFQTFVNTHGTPVYTYYLLKENLTTGSVECNKVIDFRLNNPAETGTYYNYEKFVEFFGRKLSSYLSTEKVNTLSVEVKSAEFGVDDNKDFQYKVVYSDVYPDLVFDYYYYYFIDISKLEDAGIINFSSSSSSKLDAIKTGTSTLEKKTLNLKLSDDFELDDTTTWTILDCIIIYEYSRENISYNRFKDIAIEELKTSGLQVNIYFDKDSGCCYLYINYNFYKLKENIISSAETGKDFSETKSYVGTSNKIENLVYTTFDEGANKINAWVNNYDIRTKVGSVNLSINPDYKGSKTYSIDANNISFTIGNNIYYLAIDTNVSNTNYKINTANFGTFTVETLIKTSSWVEKLMNDMQVYYPDLNWGVLLATDGWIDTLGEFTSAYTSGLYVGNQNSANTTAAGLVLSEFFMSVATEVDSSYANYEYSSIFDEDTIKALMLSLVGEENYTALVFEAQVFMDFFNSCFAPIIDDFAAEFGESIGENSLRLNAYKSYLATLLLSSDIGEYLYTIATRVYAEYTICEYLANAAGDYQNYYGYVNNLKDEEGNLIESYEFGSFVELVIYENEYCGNSNPTFTFNFKKAFEKYTADSYNRFLGKSYEEVISNESYYQLAVQSFIEQIKEEYEEIYNNGYIVSEFGEVVDEYGNVAKSYKDETPIYCYMIHVLYSIKAEVNDNEPTYLRCYEKYIDGNISRWNVIKGQDISDADQYIEGYDSDNTTLSAYQVLSGLSIMRSFLPNISLEGESFLDILKNFYTGIFADYKNFLTGEIDEGSNVLSWPVYNVKKMVEGTEIEDDVDYFISNALSVILRMGTFGTVGDFFKEIIPADMSEETSWEVINEFYDAVSRIYSELVEIRDLLPGEQTEKGSKRGSNSDAVINSIINTFQNVKYNVNQYISARERMDMVEKRSITFTLAQYGANYVTTGYKFSVRNKEYTFKSSTDPVRLAEYVYGGAFLESVGVGAQYTSPEFTGIIKATKVYDNVDKVLKTNLDSWSELRTFVSEIASKTAELYFLTNLGDLDISKENAVKLTDLFTVNYGSNYNSIEEALYKFIIDEIDINILARITNTFPADGSEPTSKPEYSHKNFIAVSKYLFRNDISDEDLENITLEDYKRYAVNELIKNEENSDETPEERAGRYLTLFNLISVQVDLSAGGDSVGRTLIKSRVERTDTGSGVDIKYKNLAGSTLQLTGKFSSSTSTLESVKTLAGLENRPTREVLTRQYSGLTATDYYDEAYGNTFIACTYKDGLYYPIMSSGSKNCSSPKFNEYYNNGYLNAKFVSNYYSNEASVVIMKGIITADGYPTAIRKYNNPIEVQEKKFLKSSTATYNAVTYYRTNIGGNMTTGDDLVDVSRAVGRVTTKNYTTYVSGTSFTKGIGSTTTYTGKTNLRTIVRSDVSMNFVQVKNEYLMQQSDDYGAISVIDEFSYFYVFGGVTWLMLMLAFITIIPVMINAVGGAATRIFDMIVLFLASPIVISTNSLYDGKNKIYDGWKKSIQSVALGVLGYILGFSSFTILIPMVFNTSSFVSYSTYNKIKSISGFELFLSYSTVNSLMRYLWVLTAVSLIVKLPKTLLPIITANNGDIKSPDPSLDGSGKPFIDKTKEFAGQADKFVDKLGSVVTGQALMGLVTNAKDELLDMIPGSGIAKGAIEKAKAKNQKKKDKEADQDAKHIEELLKSYGINGDTAKAAGKAVKDAEEKRKKDEAAHKKFKEDSKAKFQKHFM